MKCIKLENSYNNTDKFPLSFVEFAHLFLYMYNNFDSLPEPAKPVYPIFKKDDEIPNAYLMRLKDKDELI